MLGVRVKIYLEDSREDLNWNMEEAREENKNHQVLIK